VLVFQASISDFKFDVLVAISDSGIINRAKDTEIPEVHKADQITEILNNLLSGYAGTNKNFLTLKVNYQLADSSMEKITKYLLQSHKPKSIEKEAVEVVIKDTTRLKKQRQLKRQYLSKQLI
jgi:hypothetical protein